MSKDAFYLKHDLDARNDPKLIKLRMAMGAKGYGIYWLVTEKMYSQEGRLERDFKALSWEFHESEDDIKSVVDDFGLFYDNDGRISCRRVDRDLSYRREIQRQASEAGKASAAQRALNRRSTAVQQGEERRGDREDITTANGAPSAVDFSEVRLPKGMGAYGGAYVRNVPADECQFIIRTMRPGASVKAALEWRIKLKREESEGRANDGFKKPDGEKP